MQTFPQVYSVSGMLIEVKSLVSVFIGSLSGVLDIIQELLKSIVLTTAIIVRVVTFLSKLIIGGITEAIYSAVIGEAVFFTYENLHKNKSIPLFTVHCSQQLSSHLLKLYSYFWKTA